MWDLQRRIPHVPVCRRTSWRNFRRQTLATVNVTRGQQRNDGEAHPRTPPTAHNCTVRGNASSNCQAALTQALASPSQPSPTAKPVTAMAPAEDYHSSYAILGPSCTIDILLAMPLELISLPGCSCAEQGVEQGRPQNIPPGLQHIILRIACYTTLSGGPRSLYSSALLFPPVAPSEAISVVAFPSS